MVYSSEGRHLTEQFEGDRLKAYPDSKGVLTIGYGHTHGVYPGATCSQEQADTWLQEDIAWAASEVNRLVRVPMNQRQFDALVDFTFNCGAGNTAHSTLLELINRGDFEAARNEFEKWDKAGGRIMPGLLRRRIAEAAEFAENN